jgi:3-oxoacyl-[acyl-carrier-protein] synthase II
MDVRDSKGRWRVAITGMGVKTPAGNDLTSFWSTMSSGRSVAGPITRFDASELPVQIACEVKDFDPLDYTDRKSCRHMDRVSQLGFAAAMDAIADAGAIQRDPARSAVIFGTGTGGVSTFAEQTRVMIERGPQRVSPYLVPMLMPNATGALIAIELGWTGPVFSVGSACASSASALGEGLRLVQHGYCDAVLAGGGEAGVSPWAIAAFARVAALSTRNHEPSLASRPFDATRDGYVMGEGASFVVLERLDQALERGARIYAVLQGYGINCDAYHITAPTPDGSGAAACILQALSDAEVSVRDVGHVNAHGTSTVLNDAMEANALRKVFGDRPPPVTAPKSVFGHLMGGAGAAEAVATVHSIVDGVIPPTANYERPDPECPLDVVVGEARKIGPAPVISNSFGFGGHNAVLVFAPHEG